VSVIPPVESLSSKLMDASSLFLTANADTVDFLGCIDLSKHAIGASKSPNRASDRAPGRLGGRFVWGVGAGGLAACPVSGDRSGLARFPVADEA